MSLRHAFLLASLYVALLTPMTARADHDST